MPSQEVGMPIPNIPHAVSVTLPTWEATIGYEEGEEWVVSKMNSGYPRFFIHPVIQELARQIEAKYGRENEKAVVFPSYKVAKRCRDFVKRHSRDPLNIRVLQLATPAPETAEQQSRMVATNIGVVFVPTRQFPLAKNYWQHSGEGISSRMGEYVLRELFRDDPAPATSPNHNLKKAMQVASIQSKSPSLSFGSSQKEDMEKEYTSFIEQKFGRVLDLKFGSQAKTALKRRICCKVEESAAISAAIDESQGVSNGAPTSASVPEKRHHLSENDVYLFPSGMASIFYAHHALLNTRPPKESVCFGFPYVDTLNILKKFGPGVHFLGLGDEASLDELEEQLTSGAWSIMALFCECPSNPLLKTPHLARIRKLADKFDFAVVVDETVGNFLNIHVLPFADMVASSLTKVFSGDSNVMAGSLILNPDSRYYPELKRFFDDEYEDIFWVEDALYLERNSRDFAQRAHKIDSTASRVAHLLDESPLIAKVYYPELNETKPFYDEIKTSTGGYGGLISFLFHDQECAINFFNAVNLHKGPSLGTNFTLACPYAILAHYQELDDIAQWDVDRNLIRISIGLEDPDELLAVLQKSLDSCKR
ncbi:cystathionine gamma-synthase [Diutina catenulata]